MKNNQKYLLLTLSLIGLILSGCTSSAHPKNQQASIMEPTDISSMDPSLISDVGANETANNVQEGLYRMKNSTEVIPGIATKIVKPTNNGTTYTFHLRKNLKWSNGDKLTAKDLVYGWERTVKPSTKAPEAYLFAPIKNATAIENGKLPASKLGVKAVNATTFQVQLNQPTPYFKYLCAFVPFLPQDGKAVNKLGSSYGTSSKKTVYDGPFVASGWNTSNENWILTKNKNYWDKKNVKLNKVTFKVVKDPQTALSLYQSKKIDNIVLSGEQAEQEKKNSGYVSYSNGETEYIAYNLKNKYLNNINIRKAISLTINRKSLVTNTLKNGSKIPLGFIPEGITKNPENGKDFAKDSLIQQSVSYNPILAKKLWLKGLKQLKQKKITLNLLAFDLDTNKQTTEFIQAAAEKYLPGLKININTQPKVQVLTKLQGKTGFDLGATDWIADFPDLSDFLQLLDSTNSNNVGSYKNKSFDFYFKKADGVDAQHKQQRYNDFKKAEQIAMKDQAVLPIDQTQMVRLNNPKLKGITYAASAGISLKNAYKSK